MKKNILAALTMIASSGVSFAYRPTPCPPETPTKTELVKTVVNDENEKLVADSTGRTLYVFDLDIGKPAPACNGDCAEVWPPYLVNADEATTLAAPLMTKVTALATFGTTSN